MLSVLAELCGIVLASEFWIPGLCVSLCREKELNLKKNYLSVSWDGTNSLSLFCQARTWAVGKWNNLSLCLVFFFCPRRPQRFLSGFVRGPVGQPAKKNGSVAHPGFEVLLLEALLLPTIVIDSWRLGYFILGGVFGRSSKKLKDKILFLYTESVGVQKQASLGIASKIGIVYAAFNPTGF